MRKNRMVYLLGSLLLVLVFITLTLSAACSSTPSSTSSKSTPAPASKASAPITLKLVSAFPLNADASHPLAEFASKVNQQSNGQLTINLLGGPEVIGQYDQATAVKSGLVDMALQSPSLAEKVFPSALALENTRDTPMEERTNGAFDLITEFYKQMNVRYLGWLECGHTYYIFSNVEIKNPRTDFKGLKFRTGPQAAGFLDALGVVGVVMPSTEIYTGLQQKVVVGAASVPNTFYEGSMFEVCKYWIDYPLWNINSAALVNLDKWNSLPKNLQDVLLNVTKEMEPEEYNHSVDADKKYFQGFKDKGMKPLTFSADDGKWFVNLAFESSWGNAQKAMTPEDYNKARSIFK